MKKEKCGNCRKKIDESKGTVKSCPFCGFAYPTKTEKSICTPFSYGILIFTILTLFCGVWFIIPVFICLYFFFKVKKDLKQVQSESLENNLHAEKKQKTESSKQSWAMTNGTAVIWDGSLEAVSFTSFDKKHKGVLVRLILKDDGEFYFDIADENTGEIETVREMELKTKIRVKSSSYDLSDLCRIKLKINLQRMYAYAEEVRSEARKPELIKTFDPVEVSFIYESQENGKTRRNIKATKYYRSKKGAEYFEGFCYTRNEERMFKASRIQSKLKVGKDYYFFNEFVDAFVNGN